MNPNVKKGYKKTRSAHRSITDLMDKLKQERQDEFLEDAKRDEAEAKGEPKDGDEFRVKDFLE